MKRARGVDDLDQLRNRIDAIDEAIVRLLHERRQVVARVARCKEALGLPVYHPAREEDLISRRREQARGCGLDPDMVEDVFRRIIRASRVTQSEELSARGVRPGARVLVVGGAGAMGSLVCRWFRASGYDVRVLERGDWGRAGALCEGIDLAVISVPIRATPEVARRLGPFLPPSCVLADLTSLKVEPVRAMLDAHAGPVLGLHPMFGPSTRVLDKQIVVATPARNPEACRWVLDQLAAWGAVVVRCTPEEHDRAMAVVQALRHFATFLFGRFLWRRDVDLEETLEYSGPIYRLELGMVGRLFAQDPELYADIILASAERRALLADFVRAAQETVRLVEAADREGFCREFRKVAEWFGPFSDQALRESSYLIEKLVERFG